MMQPIFANGIRTRLNGSLTDSATTATVNDGSILPTIGTDEYIVGKITKLTSGAYEIVHITGITTNDLTIERGKEDTTAIAFDNGDDVEMVVTSGILDALSVLDMPVQSKSADYTLMLGDKGNLINVDASGAARTITLLAAATAGYGYTIAIKKTDASGNAVTIDGNASETIDGSATLDLATQYDAVILACNGSNWFVLAEPASGGGGASLSTANTWTAGQRGEVTTLTSTSNSIAIDLADSNNFSHTMTENTTLAAPSNPVEGQSGVITITQDDTTDYTLAYNTFWKFEGGTVPELSTELSSINVFAYSVNAGGASATCTLIGDVS